MRILTIFSSFYGISTVFEAFSLPADSDGICVAAYLTHGVFFHRPSAHRAGDDSVRVLDMVFQFFFGRKSIFAVIAVIDVSLRSSACDLFRLFF